jgi:hypothetical protein
MKRIHFGYHFDRVDDRGSDHWNTDSYFARKQSNQRN